jgi:hypothetical protein
MPMTTFGHVVVFAHDSIASPRNEMGDPELNTQVASRAGVELEGFIGTNGLNDVGVSPFGFRAAKAGLQTINIQGFWVFSLTTARSIAPRHGKA